MTCWLNDDKNNEVNFLWCLFSIMWAYESSTVLGMLIVAFETILNSYNVKWRSIYHNGEKPLRSIYDVEDNNTGLICSLYLSYGVQTHSHFWPLSNTKLWNQCIYSRNKGDLENCTHFVGCSCWQRHCISTDDVYLTDVVHSHTYSAHKHVNTFLDRMFMRTFGYQRWVSRISEIMLLAFLSA